MPDVLVELDDSVIERLKVLADRNGRTVEEEARDMIIRAAPLTPEERVEYSRRIRAMQAKPATLLSEDVIREARDKR